MADAPCVHCHEAERDHHAYEAAPTPKGCVCADDGSWGNRESIPAVCSKWEAADGDDTDDHCDTCSHDSACHSEEGGK